MDQIDCRFVKNLFADLECMHTLHLYTDTAKWISFFGRSDTPCVVSLCHRKHAYHSHETKFLAVLHLKAHTNRDVKKAEGGLASAVDLRNEQIIDLYSSDEFHLHYGLEKATATLVVGPVPVFPLSRVILSAKTENTFDWANSNGFETGLMIAGTCHKNLLARQDDQFLAIPHKTFGEDQSLTLHHFKNLVTVECYPVKQGFIHVNTEVIITESISDDRRVENVEVPLTNVFNVKFISQDCLRKMCFKNGRFDPQMDVVCCENVATMLNVIDGDFVKIEILFPEVEELEDGFLSLRLDNLDADAAMDEGEYFSIDVPHHEHELADDQNLNLHCMCRLRVASLPPQDVFSKLAGKSGDLDSSSLYVSPLLWFNATQKPKFCANIQDAQVKVTRVTDDCLPPYATEIHIALVLSPTYSPSAQFDNTLVKHMTVSRLLKKNDVIAINTKNNPDFLSECEPKDYSCEVLYYKVIGFSKIDEVSSHTYFQVDLKHTSVFQDGTVNSFIPRPLGMTEDSDTTAGLSDYIEAMKKILLPYVAMEMDNSTATVLVSGPAGCGKWSTVSAVCRMLNLHMLKISCYELMADSSGAMDAKITTAIQRAIVYAPCMLVLVGIDCLGRDSETGQPDHRVCSSLQNAVNSLQSHDHPIVVVGVTSNKNEVVAKIRSQFVHQIEIRNLSEKERCRMIHQLLKYMPSGRDVDVQWIAKHTVGFTYGDLWELVRQATENARQRITKECAIGSRLSWIDEMNICAAGISNQHCDFTLALQHMQSQRADVIGVPKIPDVKWDDIGGLEEVKAHIKDTIQLPLEHPELVASGLRRSGILLYGPPGTGKTLLAKAVATQCSLSFLSIKGPELINMYVGQSEENVRKVFSRARDAAPCVVFFDELDSLAPNRGRSGDSGGVMDRVVSQLLAELDGLIEADEEKQIFVIGASNRPDLIDPALLRPGRFDKLLYVGINSNKADQLKILEAQTKRANLGADVSLEDVIEVCPGNMTGADFYALTSEALMNAIRRRIAIEEEKEKSSCGLQQTMSSCEPLVVHQEDFIVAAKNIVPSVSTKELGRFEAIRSQLAAE